MFLLKESGGPLIFSCNYNIEDLSITSLFYRELLQWWSQSTVRKKMAAVHFTTIPCESNAANRHIESHIFYEILSCTNSIVYARFEVYKSFLCIFMNVFRVFVRNELWVSYQSPSFSVWWIPQ